jgi:hypothetical protein
MLKDSSEGHAAETAMIARSVSRLQWQRQSERSLAGSGEAGRT